MEMTYRPVAADCAEDQGLPDNRLISWGFTVKRRSDSSENSGTVFISAPIPLWGPLEVIQAEMPLCPGSTSSVPRWIVYWAKQ